MVVDLIRSIVASMNFEIPVNSEVSGVYYVCKTLTAKPGKIVEDADGNKFKVVDFVYNESLTLAPYGHGIPFEGTTIYAPAPLFLHGTPMSVNSEYLWISNQTRSKTPFIWLLRGYKEKIGGNQSAIEVEAPVRLFFMDEADEPKWVNDQHDQITITPIRGLVDQFIAAYQDMCPNKKLDDYEITDRPRFGVEVTQGSGAKIIDEDLSGAQLDIVLRRYKSNKPCC